MPSGFYYRFHLTIVIVIYSDDIECSQVVLHAIIPIKLNLTHKQITLLYNEKRLDTRVKTQDEVEDWRTLKKLYYHLPAHLRIHGK